MRKVLFTIMLTCIAVFGATTQVSAQLINEIVIAAPGTDASSGCEYVEFRGVPNAVIGDFTFVDVEGDIEQNVGLLNYVRSLQGVQFGSNGLVVITDGSSCRAFASGTTVVTDSKFRVGQAPPPANPNATFSKATRNNGTNSFHVVAGQTALVQGQDADSDNDGVLDFGVPFDGFAVRDTNNAADVAYGVVLPRPSGIPSGEAINAATRFPGDTTRNSASAWYFGDLEAVSSTLFYNRKPSTRSANFPAGGQLTPGDQNVPFFSLTILQSNDGESKVVNSGTADFGGVARFATVVNNLRNQAAAENSSLILINAGDNIIPGPNFNANFGNPSPSGRYYDSIALDRIGFDALGIGNHEFDSGPDVFAKFVEDFEGDNDRFPSANLNYTGEPRLQALKDAGILVDSFILTRNVSLQPSGIVQQQKIGVIGLTTPLLPAISSPRNVTVDPNLVAVTQQQINNLTAQGANIIVLTGQLQTINNDRALVQQVSGLDIVISGGGQETLANPGALLVPGDTATLPYPVLENDAAGRAVPIVTTNGDYKYVGRLITQFDSAGNLVSIDPRSNPVRVAGGNQPDAVQPEPSIQQDVVVPVQTYLNSLATNVIATTDVGLDGRRGQGSGDPALVQPGIRTTETNLGSLFADALLFEARRRAAEFGVPANDVPTVAIQNGGGIRNNNIIGPGNVTELNTYQIANFFNIVAIAPNIPATQFKEILENAVSRVNSADGRFAQISGFRFVYDENLTAQVVDNSGNVTTLGNRVREVQLLDGPNGTPGTFVVQNGIVVNPALTIDVATIDFLTRGGDQYPYRGAPFTIVGSTYQEALFRYITFPTVQGGLGGVITGTQYPAGGSGRITRLN